MTINKINSLTAFNPKNLAKFLLLISINPYKFIIKIRLEKILFKTPLKQYSLKELKKNQNKIIKKLFKESFKKLND